jgi:hypothetical protein
MVNKIMEKNEKVQCDSFRRPTSLGGCVRHKSYAEGGEFYSERPGAASVPLNRHAELGRGSP